MQTLDDIEQLNQQFSISGLAQVVAGNAGLPMVRITAPAASADVYLHGAHLTSWKPADAEEVIFLSAHSRWEDGQSIRGGIPICFPWFRAKADNPDAPVHGFVRTKSWRLESISNVDDRVTVTFSTDSDSATKELWPYDFRATYRVSVSAVLDIELIVANTGKAPFRFEEALHTYHQVGQVETLSIHGLDGIHFLDNTDSNHEKIQQGDLVFRQKTDNAYLDARYSLDLIDPALNRRVHIGKENSRTTVVWNPWEDGARLLPDLGNEEWRNMACVEASNMNVFAITLPPGQEHRMKASIHVAGLAS